MDRGKFDEPNMKFCNNFDFLKETDNSLDMLDGANPKTEVFSGYLSRNKDISSVFFCKLFQPSWSRAAVSTSLKKVDFS